MQKRRQLTFDITGPRHRSRYYRYKNEGLTMEKIAEEDGATVRAVQNSIRAVQRYYAMYNEDELRRVQQRVLIETADTGQKMILEGLQAMKTRRRGNKLVTEPDWPVRMECQRLWNEMSQINLHKSSPGTIINNSPAIGVSTGQGTTNVVMVEDRIRKINAEREAQGLLPPAVTVEAEAEDDGDRQ